MAADKSCTPNQLMFLQGYEMDSATSCTSPRCCPIYSCPPKVIIDILWYSILFQTQHGGANELADRQSRLPVSTSFTNPIRPRGHASGLGYSAGCRHQHFAQTVLLLPFNFHSVLGNSSSGWYSHLHWDVENHIYTYSTIDLQPRLPYHKEQSGVVLSTIIWISNILWDPLNIHGDHVFLLTVVYTANLLLFTCKVQSCTFHATSISRKFVQGQRGQDAMSRGWQVIYAGAAVSFSVNYR